MRRPVKLPGPTEMWTCSIWSGFLLKRCRMSLMAGKISALCLIGAEKVVSARIFSPRAIATEPILLDVSTAKTRGSWFIFCFFEYLCFVKRLFLAVKKRYLGDYFFLDLPKLSSLSDGNLNIIGQVDINQIFLLQYLLFYYKLDYHKYGLLELEVVKNVN